MAIVSPAEIAAANAGDRDAIEAVARRAGQVALPLAISVLRDHGKARDVAQDVAVDVLRGLRRLREPDRFDAWVRRIAVRKSLRAARAQRARWRSEVPLHELIDSDREPASKRTEQSFVLHDALQTALGDLPPRQRLALVLRYVQGLSDEEIAAALGCRPGTAASLLSRGRAALRQHRLYPELVSGGSR